MGPLEIVVGVGELGAPWVEVLVQLQVGVEAIVIVPEVLQGFGLRVRVELRVFRVTG